LRLLAGTDDLALHATGLGASERRRVTEADKDARRLERRSDGAVEAEVTDADPSAVTSPDGLLVHDAYVLR